MGRYSNMTLTELRKADRGLEGNVLLAKLEGVQILHEQQDYTDVSGSLIEPQVTEYFEKEVELTKIKPGRLQPRSNFDNQKLMELKA